MIPVTIVTGFLGAGKTSLLNHLLKNYPNKRFAIIENEVGALSIDHELLLSAEEGIFQLSNGCICCSLQGDLVATLEKLLSLDQGFDHLLIETTGIAAPDSIAAAFLADPDLQTAFQLDAVLCVVDAVYALEIMAEREEARRQVSFSDRLLISKSDLVSPKELEALEQQLHQANPLALIGRCDQGQPDIPVLDIQAYRADKVLQNVEQVQHCCGHDHEHKHEHHHHHHEDIQTESFEFGQAFDLLKLRHWLQVLLLIQGERVYRIKGIIQVKDVEERMILQSVQKIHTFQKAGPWPEGEAARSKIVFIGKALRRDILEKNLKHCLAN